MNSKLKKFKCSEESFIKALHAIRTGTLGLNKASVMSTSPYNRLTFEVPNLRKMGSSTILTSA